MTSSFLKTFLLFLLLSSTLAPAQSHAYRKRHRAPAKPVVPAQPVTPLRFEDVAAKAGLTSSLTCGGDEKRYIMEALCGGVAFFDYDNDGWADILLVGGSRLEAVRSPASADCAQLETRLYHNNRNGTVTDVTARSGLNPRACRWGFGVAVGDYDNDGNDDLYI